MTDWLVCTGSCDTAGWVVVRHWATLECYVETRLSSPLLSSPWFSPVTNITIFPLSWRTVTTDGCRLDFVLTQCCFLQSQVEDRLVHHWVRPSLYLTHWEKTGAVTPPVSPRALTLLLAGWTETEAVWVVWLRSVGREKCPDWETWYDWRRERAGLAGPHLYTVQYTSQYTPLYTHVARSRQHLPPILPYPTCDHHPAPTFTRQTSQHYLSPPSVSL